MPSASTKPPMTAANRVDLRRQNAIITGALNIETAQLVAPSQPTRKNNNKNNTNIIRILLLQYTTTVTAATTTNTIPSEIRSHRF